MDHVDVGKLRIAYQRRGDGPTVLLLHGAVCDSRVWRVELETFADEFTVVAWDAPGCGQSTDAPDGFTMDDYADCVAGFVDSLDIGPAQVVGHSWGTTVALLLGLRRPELVSSLVLVGGYAGWRGSLPTEEVKQRLAFARSVADAGTGAFDPHSARGFFSDVMPEDRATELAQIMSESRPAATRTMAEALAQADLRDDLRRVSAPTLVVHGSDDERSTSDVAQQLHDGIAGSTLVVLPGLGHESYTESADAFAHAVLPFLRSNAS